MERKLKMASSSSAYQLVVMDCPYDTWDQEITQELFVKNTRLKLKGYLVSYPYGALPVDTTDFVGTHHMICEKRESHLVPVMAYKSITASRCKIHNLPFPAISLMQSAGALDHMNLVIQILNQAEQKGHEISYDGSWTMNPEFRKDKVKSEELKEIMVAINVLYHTHYQIPEVLGLGLLRFKTELFFKNMGYEQLSHNGSLIPSVQMRSLQDEPVVLMHLREFSAGAQAMANRFKSLWENRIEIADPSRRARMAGSAAMPAKAA